MTDKGGDSGGEWQGKDQAKESKQNQEDKATGKFTHYRQNSAQFLANRLKAKGHLYRADMAALISTITWIYEYNILFESLQSLGQEVSDYKGYQVETCEMSLFGE